MIALKSLKKVLIYIASLSVIFASLVFSYTILIPGDVLKDWELYLTKDTFSRNETITVESRYTKLKAIDGKAVRYLECKNKTGSFLRYDINQRVADNAPGTRRGTGIEFKIPEAVITPTTCKFSIVVTYEVYPWRKFTEFNSTKDFLVY